MVRPTTSGATGWRMRSAAGRSRWASSACTASCSDGEAVEAELAGQPHDRRRARAGLVGQLGDRSERNELRPLEDDVGHPPLGRRQVSARLGDALGHIHRPGSLRRGPPARNIVPGGRRAGRGWSGAGGPDCRHGLPGLPSRPRADRSPATTPSGVHPTVSKRSRRQPGACPRLRRRPVDGGGDRRFRDLFGAGVEVLLVWGGSGANVLALATWSGRRRPWCAPSRPHQRRRDGRARTDRRRQAHRCPQPDGKLRPEQIEALTHMLGVEHHAQPGVVSITQSTEMGTLYSVDEVRRSARSPTGTA